MILLDYLVFSGILIIYSFIFYRMAKKQGIAFVKEPEPIPLEDGPPPTKNVRWDRFADELAPYARARLVPHYYHPMISEEEPNLE